MWLHSHSFLRHITTYKSKWIGTLDVKIIRGGQQAAQLSSATYNDLAERIAAVAVVDVTDRTVTNMRADVAIRIRVNVQAGHVAVEERRGIWCIGWIISNRHIIIARTINTSKGIVYYFGIC